MAAESSFCFDLEAIESVSLELPDKAEVASPEVLSLQLQLLQASSIAAMVWACGC